MTEGMAFAHTALTALLVTAGIASAAPVETMRFDSGLRVAIYPDPNARVVAVSAVVGAGRVHDPEGAEGAAHLLEHLWYRSTDGAGTPVNARMTAAGCVFNAWTSDAHTLYTADCPPEQIDLLLTLESSRLNHPLAGITEAHVALEAGVTSHEEEERLQHPENLIWREIHRALYRADHPVNQREDRARMRFEHLALQHLTDFAEAQYTPDNTSIAITGPFAVDDIRDRLAERFGPTSRPGEPRERPVRPPARRAIRLAPREVALDIEAPFVVLTWDVPVPDALTGTLMSDLIASRMGLMTVFRDDVLGLDCRHESGGLAAPLVCRIALSDDTDAAELAQWLRYSVVDLWKGRGARSLKKRVVPIRSHIQVGIRAGRDWQAGRARTMAVSLYLRDDPAPWGPALARLEKITARDVLQLARTWMSPDAASILIVRPGGQIERDIVPRQEAVELPDAPPVRLVRTPPALVTEERTLANGMRLLAIQRRDSEMFTALVRMRRDRPSAGGTSDLVDLIAMPALSHEWRVGVVLNNVGTADGEVHDARSLAADSVFALVSLRDALERRSLVYGAMDRVLGRESQSVYLAQQRPGYWADALVDAALYPGQVGTYRPLADRVGEVDRARREALAQELQRRSRSDNAELVMVGPAVPEAQLDWAEGAFASWEGGGPSTEPERQERALPSPQVFVIDDPEAVSADVHLGCPVTPDLAGSQVLEVALSRLLMERLRYRTGLSYYPAAVVDGQGDRGALHLYATVSPGVAGEVITHMKQAIREVADGLDPSQLALARTGARASFDPRSRPPAEAAYLALSDVRMATAAGLAEHGDRLSEVDEIALASAVEGCVDHAVIAVTGPAETLAESVQGSIHIERLALSEVAERLLSP